MKILFSRYLLFFSIILKLTPSAWAAGVIVHWQNEPGFELRNFVGSALAGGIQNQSGDGTLLELGYYNLATTAEPFSGDWIPFTGQSVSGGQVTTIGDKGLAGDGLFSITSQFDTDNDLLILPAIGRPLSIRFYQNTSSQPIQLFNAVSSENWILPAPSDPIVELFITLKDGALVWQGGTATAFRTRIPIPEPAQIMLIGLSFIFVVFRRIIIR